NTPDDEVSYVLSLDGRKAYMASSKDGGYGDLDLYEIVMANIYINTMVVYNGLVTDINNNIPDNLKIKVFDENENLMGVYRAGKQGYYLILDPGKEYLVQYEADGYLIATTTLSPDKENVQSFMKKYEPIPIEPIVLMAYKYQDYVYFEQNSEHYSAPSMRVLDDVINKNTESNKLIVNINSVPGKEREMLTRQRSENIIDYLVANGVNEKNIYSNGRFPAGYKDVYCIDMRELDEFVAVTEDTEDTQEVEARDMLVPTGDTVVIENIFFAFDKYDIQSKYIPNLNVLADYLKNNPSASLEIGGHTDWLGTNEYNYLLSYKRSKAVKDYLVAKGANAESLITVKYGEGTPIADNVLPSGADNPAGRQLNRRAEFKVMQQGTEALLYVKPIIVPQAGHLASQTGQQVSKDISQTGKFTIQIMALRKEVPVNHFADLVGVKLHKSDDGWHRYYVGSFTSFREAKASLEQLKSMGYEPFIQRLSFFE
ncbi:MAG: OmpA family protein, partial [Bacteroidales bacterium]|nr:OmpA family protein [Bacteroidales bacterium]